MQSRSNWHAYFASITKTVATRSTCPRAQVGAVIVRDRSILSTGYNGAPKGQPHCTEVGCLLYKSTTPTGQVETNCYRTTHAELNAIIQAARNGTSIQGADIYITHSPCYHCLKALINSDIRRVFFVQAYKLEVIKELASAAAIEFYQILDTGEIVLIDFTTVE